jgi:uncharacterized protein (TIGR02246 family)
MTVHTAPPHTDTDTRAILQIVQEMLTAQEAEDVEAWLEFVDEDAVWLPPNEAPITGKAAIRDWVIGFYDLYSVAEEMTSAEVHVTGDWAYIMANWAWTITPKAGGEGLTDTGKSIWILSRQVDESWKITRAIWNGDEAPPSF